MSRTPNDDATLAPLVIATLDRYAQGWTSMHRQACVAHARKADSAQVLDRRMRCLRQRRLELRAATEAIVALPPDAVTHAGDLAANLRPIDDCADLELLTRELSPPITAEDRATADRLRGELARLEAMDRAGQPEGAIAGLRDLLPRIRQVQDPGLLIDALLTLGRILQVRREPGPAAPALTEAEQLALSHGALHLAIEAAARRLFVEAVENRRVEALLAQAELLEPLAQGLSGDRFAVPLLLNNLGAMHLARGEAAKARDYFERAKAVIDAIPEPRLELLVVDRNVALTTGGAVGERLAYQTLVTLRQRLGADNPTTIEAATVSSHLTRDPRDALAIADDFIARTARLQPGAVESLVDEGRYAAFLAAELGDTAAQRTYLRHAVALPMTGTDEVVRAIHQLATAELALLDDDLDPARAAFTMVAATRASSADWWVREYGAAGLVGLATIARARGDDRTAMRQLDEAIAIYVDTVAKGNNQDPMRRLARARVMRAELARAHRDVDLAARLEAAALAYYRSTEAPAYAAIIARLSAAAPPQPPQQQPPPSQQP